MSNPSLRVAPGQFFMWGTILVGIWAAYYAGNSIADDGYLNVLVDFAVLTGVLAVIVVRKYWWIPVFVIMAFGYTSTGLGFKVEGTDLMALFGFACLAGMLSLGQLHAKNTHRNLGIFFYLLLIYVLAHAALYGMDNYFNGETQFKNILKRYYAVVIPLFLIWCMDRFAHEKGLRKCLNLMILVSIFFSLAAVVVTLLGVSIPGISNNLVDFVWADSESSVGYLRWAILPILLLALCLRASAQSHGQKGFYLTSFLLLLPLSFFGGGRMSLLMILLFILIWMILRKKWKQVVVGGWLIFCASVFLLLLGHTLDARQLQNMPKSFQNVERAISIFLPSDQVNQEEVMTEGSNQWHEDLMQQSWDYANVNLHTMIFGNGFKGWDDSIDINLFSFGEAYDSAVKMAVHMGSSETLFFSVLPIFGWVGVILYYGFMIEIMRRNLRVMKICPEGSLGKSLCEFSFCFILTTLLVSPFTGGIPTYNMIYWMIGFIAAEPYLVKAAPQQIAPMFQRYPMAAMAFKGGKVEVLGAAGE